MLYKKSVRITLIALVVILAGTLIVPAATAHAASPYAVTPQSVIVTQDQINKSYRFTNPILRSVSNKQVSFNADGTVVISATITHRDGTTHDAQTVWKPYVTSGGVLVFGFQSATVNGATATSADRSNLIYAHRYIVRDAIRDYVRSQVKGPFKYANIIVTAGQVEIDVNVYSA